MDYQQFSLFVWFLLRLYLHKCRKCDKRRLIKRNNMLHPQKLHKYPYTNSLLFYTSLSEYPINLLSQIQIPWNSYLEYCHYQWPNRQGVPWPLKVDTIGTSIGISQENSKMNESDYTLYFLIFGGSQHASNRDGHTLHI